MLNQPLRSLSIRHPCTGHPATRLPPGYQPWGQVLASSALDKEKSREYSNASEALPVPRGAVSGATGRTPSGVNEAHWLRGATWFTYVSCGVCWRLIDG